MVILVDAARRLRAGTQLSSSAVLAILTSLPIVAGQEEVCAGPTQKEDAFGLTVMTILIVLLIIVALMFFLLGWKMSAWWNQSLSKQHRSVAVQAPVHYARDRSQPRFLPLPEGSHGAWPW